MFCAYHDDLDGRCSATIIRQAYPDCRFEPVFHENPFPFDKIEQGENVILVDFTPGSKEDFEKIYKLADGNVVWIDHHGANIKKYPQYKDLEGLRVDNKPSGAMLTWQYMNGSSAEPLAVFLTSDFDTWTHSDERSMKFHAGMQTMEHGPDAEIWEALLGPAAGDVSAAMFNEHSTEQVIEDIIERGRIVLLYRDFTAAEQLARFGYETEFEGFKTVACCNNDKGSEFFGEALDKYDLAISYCHNGKQFVFGIYSRKPEINCAEIAKKYNGGGHPGAAGMNLDELPFKFGKALRDVKS